MNPFYTGNPASGNAPITFCVRFRMRMGDDNELFFHEISIQGYWIDVRYFAGWP